MYGEKAIINDILFMSNFLELKYVTTGSTG